MPSGILYGRGIRDYLFQRGCSVEQQTPLLAGKPPTAVRLVKGKGEFSQPSESVKLCGNNAVSGCLVIARALYYRSHQPAPLRPASQIDNLNIPARTELSRRQQQF